jgi:hypothetical protein
MESSNDRKTLLAIAQDEGQNPKSRSMAFTAFRKGSEPIFRDCPHEVLPVG